MKSFKSFLTEQKEQDQLLLEQVQLFEHEKYKLIPGSKNSFRQDPGNTSSKTIQHSHTYAKPNGKGSQLYAVNVDGTGHDGSSGIVIPASHADFFRSKGYKIKSDNILECLYLKNIKSEDYSLILLESLHETV